MQPSPKGHSEIKNRKCLGGITLNNILLCLILIVLLTLKPAIAEKSFTVGQWKAVTNGGARILGKSGTVAEAYIYGFEMEKEQSIPDGIRYIGKIDGKPAAADYTLVKQRLHCQIQAETIKAGAYMLLLSFAGDDLSGSTVRMDNDDVRIPAKVEKNEFQHATHYRFFRDQPLKSLGVDIPVCGFANLRDFRKDGRTDLQMFVIPDANNTIEIIYDFTTGRLIDTSEAWAGQGLIRTDDLHLPDLSLCRNLVQNPGFEGDLTLWGEGVTDIRMPPKGKAGWVADTTITHTGKGSALYTVAKGYNPPMLCTWPIAVSKGDTYTVSFYAKTDRPGEGFTLFIHTAIWPEFPLNNGMRIQLTSDWKRYTATFTAPNPFLRLCFGDRWWDNQAQDQIDGAHVWLDDVQFESGDKVTDFIQKPVFAYSTVNSPNSSIALNKSGALLNVQMVNSSDKPMLCTANITLRDIYKNPLRTVKKKINLQPYSHSTVPVPLTGIKARGLLRVEMAVTNGSFKDVCYGRIAFFVPITDPGKMRYGMHVEQPTLEYVRYMEPFGVYGSLGFLELSNPALAAQFARSNFLHIESPTYSPGCPAIPGEKPASQVDWDAYDVWLAKQISPYPAQLYWKTINEPNVGGYKWTPADCVRAVALMRKHIKATNPKALVLTPDPYNASRDGQMWMEEFFKAGGNKLVDAIAIHTYRARPESPDLDTDIQSLKTLKANYGLAKAPIFFTEGEGVPIYSLPDIGMSPFGGFFEWRLDLLSMDIGRAELDGGAMMVRTLLACMKNADQVKFYLSWQDDIKQGQPVATLATTNYLLSQLRNATFRREMLIGTDTKTYIFEAVDKRPTAVMWCHDLKVERGDAAAPIAHLPMPGAGWHISDMMGNPLNMKREGNVWSFPLSGHPVYVSGPVGSLPALSAMLEKSTIGDGGVKNVEMNTRLTGNGQGKGK